MARPRLNDTEALARKGLRSPYARVAPLAIDSCPERVQNSNRGHFQRDTNAGDEDAYCAIEELKK